MGMLMSFFPMNHHGSLKNFNPLNPILVTSYCALRSAQYDVTNIGFKGSLMEET